MIAAPPLLAGAAKLTVACVLPATALALVGAPGTVAGVTALDGALAGPEPTLLVAVTVKVYVVPLVSPVIVTGLPAPIVGAWVAPMKGVTV